MWNTLTGEKRTFKRFFFTKMNRINRIGPHNLDVISLLVGRLLGDRYASKRYENKKYSYVFVFLKVLSIHYSPLGDFYLLAKNFYKLKLL